MADALLRPIVVTSLAVLVVNDHVAKPRWPGVVTGKVSDVAGLVFFPLLLAALWEVTRRVAGRGPVRHPARVLRTAAAVTATGFAAVKLSPVVADGYSTALGWLRWPVRAGWSVLVGAAVPAPRPLVVRADPTDVLALPAVLVAVSPNRRPRWPARR